ncbi:hypothetical protein Q31b_14170 [Novipirellula aureliae]|uniref:DUF4405 domain-containing protein n=1 Tax=Novipirellula aureliae TaxID=2527966 RepID=A0A5C6E5B8_9BACT|nr:hypothetical protein [Novipirellula aureliae]TWU43885.1 hypothetical protein Q31b_14170 [Novipirellula aureliae]
MRHFVNIGLLLAFITLVATGVMAFFLPFSIVTTRTHVVSGLLVFVLVAMHVATRIPYFQTALRLKIRGFSWQHLVILVSLWGAVTGLSVLGWSPATWLMENSYEARYRKQIFRASSLAGFGQPSPHSLVIARNSKQANDGELSVLLSFVESLDEIPSLAVWAESTAGTMIETLFLQDKLAYREELDWHGKLVRRNHILPIWRHRYTVVSGVSPDGEVDGTSGATDTHAFALDKYLVSNQGNRFVICVELNMPSDSNEDWPDPELGQPSLLYTALVDVDRDSPHAIIELTGHGGDAEQDGHVRYDLDRVTTAKDVVDLFIVKLQKIP